MTIEKDDGVISEREKWYLNQKPEDKIIGYEKEPEQPENEHTTAKVKKHYSGY